MANAAVGPIDERAIAAFQGSAGRSASEAAGDQRAFEEYDLQLQAILAGATANARTAVAARTSERDDIERWASPAGAGVPTRGGDRFSGASLFTGASGSQGALREPSRTDRNLLVMGSGSIASSREESIGVVTLGGSTQPAATSSSASTPTSRCSLFAPGADRVSAGDCMQCHGMSQTHPVELDYAAAAARRPEFYRSVDEVIRRGVFLPDGQVKCVTCHDPRSPWKDKIALPPGAAATPAVDLGKPQTYERPRSRTAAVATLPPGSAVTPTPLCQSCHTYGD